MSGARPKVRRRLRSRKMALWRDLIPRLHRADHFDSRLHLLDDYDNETTFEESGTRRLPPSDWDANTVASLPPTGSTARTTQQRLPDVATSTRMTVRTVTTSESSAAGASLLSTTTGHSGEPAASSHNDDHAYSTLLKTAAVGCALLALNVLVFTAVLCQWRGLRRTRLTNLHKYASADSGGDGSGEVVLAVPCTMAATGDAAGVDPLMTAYAGTAVGRRCQSTTPSPTGTATVLTPAECTCNNVDGGIGLSGVVLTAGANSYYATTNHVAADFISQRKTTSTV